MHEHAKKPALREMYTALDASLGAYQAWMRGGKSDPKRVATIRSALRPCPHTLLRLMRVPSLQRYEEPIVLDADENFVAGENVRAAHCTSAGHSRFREDPQLFPIAALCLISTIKGHCQRCALFDNSHQGFPKRTG
jgi:hypothetical protein